MKKLILFAVILVLLCNMAVAGYAAQESLVIEDVNAAPGEVVYLTLRLTEALRGDALGVTFTYDNQYLELVEESCSWAQQGVLQDFDRRKSAGVWADSKQTEFIGEICTLAFRVVTNETYFDTVVSCTLVVKNGAQEAGSLSAQARVFSACDHEFGGWIGQGDVGHQRTCRLCQHTELEPHHWQIEAVQDTTVSVYSCGDCGARKTEEHDDRTDPTSPDGMGSTQPSSPGEDHGHTHPTGSNGSSDATSPNGSNTGDDPHAGHDHGISTADPEWFGVVAVLVLVAALAGAAVFFVKRKHK